MREANGAGSQVDRFIFGATIVCIVGASLPLILAPDRGEEVINRAFEFVTRNFGFLYIWAGCANLIFLGWLAFGRFGKRKLAQRNEPPEFSTFSWASMLFCAGIGTGVLYWGTIEWAYYYQSPPFGVEPGTTQAAEWATSYPMFHWGLTGWAFYCLPALALAYGYFVRQSNSLRLSANCRAIVGKSADATVGRIIDLLFMVGLIGAAGTGIGLAVQLISTGLNEILGCDESFEMNLAVVLAVTCVFGTSVYCGLQRGIRRLSNFNVALTLALLAFVLIVGPTLFLVKTGTNAFGHMLQNFVRMNTWTEPFGDTGFVENWTIFYWAWWIALAPFMGMFVARISRGRSIREVVFGMLGFGTLGCCLFFAVLGNYALYLERAGVLSVTTVLREQEAARAIVAVIITLPMGHVVLGLFCLVSLVFMATTYDSAAYTLALGATRRLPLDGHPARWHRMFWAFAISVLPATLMYHGGLRAFQIASIVVSLPLIGVTVLIALSFLRGLRSDHR